MLFKKIYLVLERGGGREKEREKYQHAIASHASPNVNLAHNTGLGPDWELN